MDISFILFFVLVASEAAGSTPPPQLSTTEVTRPVSETKSHDCAKVKNLCLQDNALITSCYEEKISNCYQRGRGLRDFIYQSVNTSIEAAASPTNQHRVLIPSSALMRSRAAAEDTVVVIITVLNSTLFKLSQRRGRKFPQPEQKPGVVLNGTVLMVRAGRSPVQNLHQPVILTFQHSNKVENGTCVFWSETIKGEGYWSKNGCKTNITGSKFICSCNHLSFFAVLVNPVISVSKRDAVNLSYITSVGSSLSVIFAVITLIIYACLQKRRPEKAIGIHMNLTASLLFLHLSFLLSIIWVWQLPQEGDDEGWLCKAFGLVLHWSLLATVTWCALEGFHLYLLLVRVFNIYVRRYLLKLSLVGWGFSTGIVIVCASFGVYGKQVIPLIDANNQNTTTKICLMRSQYPHSSLVTYITAVVYPSLVVLCNGCMLGVVAYKMWGHERSTGSWKEKNRENWRRLLKGSATVLGLSCIVGLPWGLTITTFLSISGIYVFTILNSLQGVFVFLWCLVMTRKTSADNYSSTRGPSSQNIAITSFNS